MLYVFLVNTGEMLTLDMALTMESVQQLHDTLSDDYQIPYEKQVLLISGGQSLDPQMRVCSYSAGTDTNPIFLFSKGTIESANPPVTTSMSQTKEDNLKLQVEGLKNLPPSYSAVVARTQLALQFHEVAKEKLRVCEGLIHNQHLQQQGWMAVIANLDDITSAFQQRALVFQQNIADFLTDRPNFLQRLEEFGDIIHILEKTPLLPCLRDGDRSPCDHEERDVSLMMWISRQDQRSTLQQMAVQCSKVLDQFNQPVLDALGSDIKSCLEAVSNPGMKEIKGLGERLFGLEQLLLQARKLLNEQAEMAQGLVQNQTRASNVKDPSVLPDLCLSHQQQLTVMYKKHLQLIDMSRRCEIAKEELCQNLHVRLRWVMYVEQQVSSVHGKMLVYHENLKRLRKRLEIIRQVCMTPKLYASAVVEVCRRRRYNTQYQEWSGRISETSVCEHAEELKRRKEFASLMHNHFLNALFPGFYELPPTFATTPPGNYDNSLPNIMDKDILLLREKVPELAESLELPSNQHFSCVTSLHTKQLPSRPLSIEIETQTELLSEELSCHPPPSPPPQPLTENNAEAISDQTSKDDDSDGAITLEDGKDPRDRPGLESQLSQPRLLSLDMPQTNDIILSPDTPELDAKFESVYRDAPFSSLLPEVDSEFHSAIGSPMDEGLVKKAKMDQILPVLRPMEENQTLKQQLQEREKILEELEERKMVLEKKLSDSESMIGDLQESVSTRSQRLEESQNTVDCLNEVVQAHVTELRTKCESIKKSVVDTRQQMKKEVLEAVAKITEYSHQVSKDSERRHVIVIQKAVDQTQAGLEKEKEVLSKQISDLNGQLEVANQKLMDLECKVREKESSSEMLKSKYQQDLEEVKTKMEEDEKQMIASMKMELEMEITDLEANIEEKEKEIRQLQIESVQRQQETTAKLQEEKLQELDNLRKEMGALHKSELNKLEMALHSRHVDEFADFKRSSTLQTESELEKQRKHLMEERSEVIKTMEKEAEERLRTAREEMQASCQKTLEEEQKQGLDAMEKQKKEMEERTKEINDQKKKHEEEMRKIEDEWKEKFLKEFRELEELNERRMEEARRQHEVEMERRRTEETEGIERIKKEMQSQFETRLAEVTSSRDKHEAQVQNLQEVLSRLKAETCQKEEELNAKWAESIAVEKSSCVEAAVEEERKEGEKRLRALRERLEEEKQEGIRIAVEMAKFEQSQNDAEQTASSSSTESTSSMASTSLSASQQQVSFNKAIAKVAATKDKRIAELEARERELVEEQHRSKDTIEKLLMDKTDLDTELRAAVLKAQEREWQAIREKERLEERMRKSGDLAAGNEDDRGSPAEMVVSTQSDGLMEVTETRDQLKALLHTKEQECSTLKRQLIHMRTSSPGGRMEKVAISDISLGDLVFIFFQEGQENFMVYSLEPTLYFLHTESLSALGLRSKGQAVAKFSWIIARITDKEYCQAKKAQNRFKVAVGTKFYRVKAIRYDPKVEHVPRK
ncbi:RB1-inducible coiled-coil protein 1-like [Lytechinus variegatus]|uniref:RB1-inducible coiled-coil protein 1-like n=1 Tax=Lytechinus variegatus TaxID=7654 RepID=UPI001BB14397|nr:RB1-inducible coiled-coil protein 1-like [Lytechinus variegatus]XP_041483965.1 RB1-inducible coiled-coil protein 1-like [Lytechinus variegatus]XP_041483966.1 RB1-inducible coiled-coil protein 1-like [Lytechinus variegatus]